MVALPLYGVWGSRRLQAMDIELHWRIMLRNSPSLDNRMQKAIRIAGFTAEAFWSKACDVYNADFESSSDGREVVPAQLSSYGGPAMTGSSVVGLSCRPVLLILPDWCGDAA